MSILAFTGATIWAGLSDLSNRTNEVTLGMMAADLNSTTFASGGWMNHLGGLRGGKLDIKGLWDAGTSASPDDLSFGSLGTGGVPVTIAPQGATVGNLAYFGTFMEPQYIANGKVGDILAFSTAGVSDAPVVRGQVANTTAKTTTGTTTGVNLSAPSATQRVYCNLHVVTVSGGTPSMTVVVQGDTSNSFPAPATIATSSAFTSAGSAQLLGTVGATTNTWYRLSLTISGSTPSFLLYAAIGVA